MTRTSKKGPTSCFSMTSLISNRTPMRLWMVNISSRRSAQMTKLIASSACATVYSVQAGVSAQTSLPTTPDPTMFAAASRQIAAVKKIVVI